MFRVRKGALAAHVPPSITTQAASGVTYNEATLDGNLTPGTGDSNTTAYFQSGLTTAYVSTAGSVTVAANTPLTRISARITSLAAGTTYHFRTVASNRVGVAYGNDFTFTTPPMPPVVVSNINDTGHGSLRTVVANALPGSVISFNSNLSGQTILLTSGPMDLSQKVTIDASALANGITIDGNANSRIFRARCQQIPEPLPGAGRLEHDRFCHRVARRVRPVSVHRLRGLESPALLQLEVAVILGGSCQ